MSLSVRPQRRSLVVKINRSQSFAGVNSSQDKPFRNFPAFSTPTVSRKSGSRVSRMFSMSHKSPPPKVPQPERLDEVYEALKKGLSAYLEVHQQELEKLSTQIRESKRNSRLVSDASPVLKFAGRLAFQSLPVEQRIFMRYGRQRWKLRGRIEANSKQVWDSEEMIFLPLITEFLSIKVTELKSLASHVVVGNVSCETKDLFAALPQVVAVDINDLGTIKLSLEVNWNPFDKEDQPSSASTVNKTSTVNKRFSTYNQSPPDTPSMREQAFYNMLRQQEELENGAAWSISSESSDDSSSPQLSGSARHSLPRPIVQPAVQATAPAIEIAFTHPEEKEPAIREEASMANGHVPYARTLSQISEASVDMPIAEERECPVPKEPGPWAVPPLETNSSPPSVGSQLDTQIREDEEQEDEPDGATPVGEESGDPPGPAPEVQQPRSSLALPSALGQLPPSGISEAPRPKPVDSGLEEAIHTLASALDDYRGQFPELQVLEQELKHLEEILLQKQGLCLSRASSTSLTVEHALESFSFLNASESEDSEGDDDNSEGSLEPMTTGNEFLDRALVLHLNHCNRLLLKLGNFGPLRCQEMYALDRLGRDVQVLEMASRLIVDRAGMASSAEEVVQFSKRKEGVFAFWDRGVAVPNVYTCSVEKFMQNFKAEYAARINDRQQGLADSVCVKLVEELLGHRLPRRQGSCQAEQVTLFQYWSHFEVLPAVTLDSYIMELAEEVLLAQNLNSDDQDVVLKALKRVPESRLRKDGLKALSLLLVEGNPKVIGAVTAQLRNLSENPSFRERALICFLEQLEDEETQTRVAACAALGCLKAKESIEQLVYLCQTDKEAVRDAAKQSLLMCGKPETLGKSPKKENSPLRFPTDRSCFIWDHRIPSPAPFSGGERDFCFHARKAAEVFLSLLQTPPEMSLCEICHSLLEQEALRGPISGRIWGRERKTFAASLACSQKQRKQKEAAWWPDQARGAHGASCPCPPCPPSPQYLVLCVMQVTQDLYSRRPFGWHSLVSPRSLD
uniref:FAM65 N-terminal domain-containing protein n=1 Tax=Pseudonaja textilis TaxID=8673 RepID=A0A670YPT1_PSETE